MDDSIQTSLITGWLPIVAVTLYDGEDVATQKFVAFDPKGNTINFLHSDSLTMSGYANDPVIPDSTPPTPYWKINEFTGMKSVQAPSLPPTTASAVFASASPDFQSPALTYPGGPPLSMFN